MTQYIIVMSTHTYSSNVHTHIQYNGPMSHRPRLTIWQPEVLSSLPRESSAGLSSHKSPVTYPQHTTYCQIHTCTQCTKMYPYSPILRHSAKYMGGPSSEPPWGQQCTQKESSEGSMVVAEGSRHTRHSAIFHNAPIYATRTIQWTVTPGP